MAHLDNLQYRWASTLHLRKNFSKSFGGDGLYGSFETLFIIPFRCRKKWPSQVRPCQPRMSTKEGTNNRGLNFVSVCLFEFFFRKSDKVWRRVTFLMAQFLVLIFISFFHRFLGPPNQHETRDNYPSSKEAKLDRPLIQRIKWKIGVWSFHNPPTNLPPLDNFQQISNYSGKLTERGSLQTSVNFSQYAVVYIFENSQLILQYSITIQSFIIHLYNNSNITIFLLQS